MKNLKKIKIFTEDDYTDAGENKSPRTQKNHVGVEIECFGPVEREAMIQYLYHTKLDKYVAVKDDGSIEPDDYKLEDYEFAICAPQSQIYQVISRLCNLLNTLKFKVNSSCGLHVHIDMRHRDINKCFENLAKTQPLLYAINPKSRKSNGYCAPTEAKTYEEYKRMESYERRGINPGAYSRHQTLEIRIHAGTLNAIKINNWIKLLFKIVNKKTIPEKQYVTLEDFKKIIRLDRKLETYIKERAIKFNKSFLGEE